jgi:hypothetical protein
MRAHLTSVSAVALGLALLTTPAHAQEPVEPDQGDAAAAPAADRAPDPTDAGQGQLGIDAPGVITDPAADARDDRLIADGTAAPESGDQLGEILRDIGVAEVGNFVGAFARGGTEDGRSVAMFIGPDDLAADDARAFTFEEYVEIQERLREGGLVNMRQVASWNVMRGRLDERAVLALGVRDPATIRAEMGMSDTAEEDGTLRDELADLDISETEVVEVTLLSGEAVGGYTVFLVVGPEGYRADDASPDTEMLSERLEQAGLQDVTIEGVTAVRGSVDDHAYLAIPASPFVADEVERANADAARPADAPAGQAAEEDEAQDR